MSTSRVVVLSDLQDFARRCKVRRTPGVAPRTATLRWVVELLLALLSDDEGVSRLVVRSRVLSMLTGEYRQQQRVPFDLLSAIINSVIGCDVSIAEVLAIVEPVPIVQVGSSSCSSAAGLQCNAEFAFV